MALSLICSIPLLCSFSLSPSGYLPTCLPAFWPANLPADLVTLLRNHTGLPSDSDMSDLESAVRNGGGDAMAIAYVRTLKRNNLAGAKQKATAAASQDGLAGLASQSNILDWADKAFGAGISTVTKGVKSLLAGASLAFLYEWYGSCIFTLCLRALKVPTAYQDSSFCHPRLQPLCSCIPVMHEAGRPICTHLALQVIFIIPHGYVS